MAALRSSIRSLTEHLGRDIALLKGSERSLFLFSLSPPSLTELDCKWGSRPISNSNQRSQVETQVESADIASSEPAPGSQTVPLRLRDYSPVLSGFSVLPHPVSGVSARLSPPSSAGNFKLEQLTGEMSSCLSQGKLEETIQLFEDWRKGVASFQGNAKVPNIVAYNLILHAKLRLGLDPRSMLKIFDEMEANGLKPNLISYNFLLRAIFRQRDSIMAERILDRMEQSGPEAQPDGDSYNFVILLCAFQRRIDAAMHRCRTMLQRGFVPSKATYNEILLAASRNHRCRECVELLKELKARNILPQLQSVVDLSMAASEMDDSKSIHLALEFLSTPELTRSARNLVMDEGGMYSLLSAAARAGSASVSDQAWSLLGNSLRDLKPPSPTSYLARIHALASAGNLDIAFTTLRELESLVGIDQSGADQEIFSPISSLRPLVHAFSRGGSTSLDSAYYELAEMNANGKAVSLSAINCVIQGCANIWDVARAYQTFESIGVTFGLTPDVHSCNSLLDVFGKTGKVAEAVQIFRYMHEVGVIPNDRTFSLLADAHVVNRDSKSALGAVHSMASAGHTPQRETLVKILRRCVKQNDGEGARDVSNLLRKLGHRDTHTESTKWQQTASL